jgi:hypothetical protein
VKHVQIDKEVKTRGGLTLLTVRWYTTEWARENGARQYRRLGLVVEPHVRPETEAYPYGFVAEHPTYRLVLDAAAAMGRRG